MRSAARLGVVVYLGAVIALTLGVPPWSAGLDAHHQGAAWLLVPPSDDLVVNLMMLLPLGVLVAEAWPGLRLGRGLLVVAALSGAVEVLQATVFTYRFAQLSDIVLNTAGFALGFAWLRWIGAGLRAVAPSR